MGWITLVDEEFDYNLPFHAQVPSPPSPIGRWSASNLTLGPVTAWAPDMGTAPIPAVGTFTPPVMELDFDGIPGVRFGANKQLTYPTTPPTIATCYIVIAYAGISGHAGTVFDLGDVTLLNSAAGALRVDAAAGDNIHPTTLTTNQRYAVSFSYDLTADTTIIDMVGTSQSGTGFTAAATTRYKFGAATNAYFDGWIYEASIFAGVHDTTTRRAELARLRAWYNTV